MGSNKYLREYSIANKMELPTHQHEIEEMLEKNMDAVFSLRKFQKELEEKGMLTPELYLDMVEQINSFTKEVALLQQRLVDVLKWQGDVDSKS